MKSQWFFFIGLQCIISEYLNMDNLCHILGGVVGPGDLLKVYGTNGTWPGLYLERQRVCGRPCQVYEMIYFYQR